MSDVQHTLASPASLTGTSLHTGGNCTITLQPAPVGHGWKFKRVDLPDQPVIDAQASRVKTMERATSLSEGAVKVQTVEHVLAALHGMGVDNALIEMDSNEPPIGDGSARPFVELIKKAGVAPQDAPRSYYAINEPLHIETKSGSLLTIVPDDKFRISCTNVGPEGRFTQFYTTEITPEIFEKEIAPARTFVFYEDVKPLLDKGLIKGGSLENAVVVKGDSVMSKEPMRFKEEFARHKMLDLIGDLALFGHPLKGHIIAARPGHSSNAELVKQLTRRQAQLLAMVPPSVIPKDGAVLDINDVMKILPHRYPFIMVDRIVAFEGDTKCTGVKTVTINEPYFQGHFPGHPVMPGVLQLEAMAQVASIAFYHQSGNIESGRVGYFMSADSVKWRKPVLPGDTLFIHVEVTKAKRSLAKAKGRCVVNNEVVSEADMLFGFIG